MSHRIIPLSVEGNVITAATVDPSNRETVNGLAFTSERNVNLVIATASQFDRLFASAFPDKSDNGAGLSDIDASADVSHLKDMASAEPVVCYVNRMIGKASRRRASDIHIERWCSKP